MPDCVSRREGPGAAGGRACVGAGTPRNDVHTPFSGELMSHWNLSTPTYACECAGHLQ